MLKVTVQMQKIIERTIVFINFFNWIRASKEAAVYKN